jgi:hypothetical protein
MTDLIHKISCAIAAQEGFFLPGTVAARNNNPGNLIDAPWLESPALHGGFWVAASIQEGQAGMMHLIALHVAEGNSLAQLIDIWAPAESGNNPAVYTRNVMAWTGITDPNAPLWNYLEPLTDPRVGPNVQESKAG